MTRTVAQKMGIKSGVRAYLMGEPDGLLKDIAAPELQVSSNADGEFEYIHFFTTSQADFNETFPKLKRHLAPTGMLWVSWPKGKKLGTDLTLAKVIELGYDHGLVESTCLSIDPVWSGLKFTHPKAGKVYANSFGKLPD